jgi:hypothetical protein
MANEIVSASKASRTYERIPFGLTADIAKVFRRDGVHIDQQAYIGRRTPWRSNVHNQ